MKIQHKSVIGIVATLASVFLIGTALLLYWLRKTDGRWTQAQCEVVGIGMALERFRGDVGRYPSASEGLEILGTFTGRGPYVVNPAGFKDPWGRPFLYTTDSQGWPTVQCLGADGRLGGYGTDADVTASPPRPLVAESVPGEK